MNNGCVPRRLMMTMVLLGASVGAPGCTTATTVPTPDVASRPDYSRPLGDGLSALRLITNPERRPDLIAAYHGRDALQLNAIDLSLVWLAAPSSHNYFPFEGITHEQARASLIAMGELLEHSPSDYAFAADVERMFDIYESVGYDGSGTVLFTAYYSPDFHASRTRTSQFDHPLYARPDDLVTDPISGMPQGRRTTDGNNVPYYTRQEIETFDMLAGMELVWLEDALSAYLIHVNGSAKLRLPDGELMYIGYAGKTDQPYASLGEAMIAEELMEPDKGSIPEIRRIFRAEPERVKDLMYRNRSFVFFTEYKGDDWPSGSLGVKVTPRSSLATDKTIYPRGGVVLVDTESVTLTGGREKLLRFMLDQDTGGAIKAPGRADIFMGIGEAVGILAGSQHAEGRLYYFFLKPEYVEQYDGT